MLSEHVIPQLSRRRKMQTVVFQHDGAPPHYSLAVRNYLLSLFPSDRIIGRGFSHCWPPRSPDLNPLDFYLWSVVKSRVFFNYQPQNIHDLKSRIKLVIENLDQEELRRSVLHLPTRLQWLLENEGNVFEHLF